MDMTEPAGWVRQFCDHIAAEPDPYKRSKLLNTFTAAAVHEQRRLRGSIAYDLRARGWGVEDVAAVLDVHRTTVRRYADDYARAMSLPRMSYRKGDRPMDVVDVP